MGVLELASAGAGGGDIAAAGAGAWVGAGTKSGSVVGDDNEVIAKHGSGEPVSPFPTMRFVKVVSTPAACVAFDSLCATHP